MLNLLIYFMIIYGVCVAIGFAMLTIQGLIYQLTGFSLYNGRYIKKKGK